MLEGDVILKENVILKGHVILNDREDLCYKSQGVYVFNTKHSDNKLINGHRIAEGLKGHISKRKH